MPLIDSTKLEKIDLENNEWVKVPAMYSYADMTSMIDGSGTTDMEKGKKILFGSIKEWNLTGADGEIAEVTEENIMLMDMASVTKIHRIITEKINLDKKKLEK